jgi:hypothetical protein
MLSVRMLCVENPIYGYSEFAMDYILKVKET